MQFVVCIQNQDYPASLEIRKLYQVIEDHVANQHNMIRVIDESGEDYLYPTSYFASIELPENLQQALMMAS
jgi:hypothetical protein